jgi:Domain of unknown function (DUF4304)
MTTGRKAMLQRLQQRLVPALRELGFSGSLPHFARIRRDSLDLLSVQFDKWGGGFVVEIARVPPEGLPGWTEVPLEKLTSYHLPLTARARLQQSRRPLTEGWFRYDHGRPQWKFWARQLSEDEQQDRAVLEVLRLLPQAEAWWMGERPQPNIRPFLDENDATEKSV